MEILSILYIAIFGLSQLFFFFVAGSFGKQVTSKYNLPFWFVMLFLVPLSNFIPVLITYYILHLLLNVMIGLFKGCGQLLNKV